MTRNLYADFEHDLSRNIKYNPKALWKYSGTKLKGKSKLGDLLNSNGELTCDATEKANILNSTFTSVFTRQNTKYIPTLDNVFNGAPLDLEDLSISQLMVENKLSKLKKKKNHRDRMGFILAFKRNSVINRISTEYTVQHVINGRPCTTFMEGREHYSNL